MLALLSGCAGTGTSVNVDWDRHQRRVAALETWQLQGRLNIRQGDSSDTININWQQDGPGFEINLSGSFGLGAVHITGGDRGVMVEKAGEEPLLADSLEALSSEYLGYAFPADRLFYWIRGIPAPGENSGINLNEFRLLATLDQVDGNARTWHLQYDRYRDHGGYPLPGRIRLEQPPYRLTFVISDWQTGTGSP